MRPFIVPSDPVSSAQMDTVGSQSCSRTYGKDRLPPFSRGVRDGDTMQPKLISGGITEKVHEKGKRELKRENCLQTGGKYGQKGCLGVAEVSAVLVGGGYIYIFLREEAFTENVGSYTVLTKSILQQCLTRY